jgi:hypothetical protein
MQHWPIIVIEVLLIGGGALAFGWWQLRELKRLRQEREAKAAQDKDGKDCNSKPQS